MEAGTISDSTIISLDELTLGRLDLQSAASLEGQHPTTLLPRGVIDVVLLERSEAFAELLAGQIQEGLTVGLPEVALAAKATRGRRPIAVLSSWERVLYRGLVDAFSPELPGAVRGKEIYESFKRAPLEEGDSDYVVMADVAACYQSIDHGLLEAELVAQTGDARIARPLSQLLHSLSGRSFGLPQNRAVSDRLADALFTTFDRQLRRAGLEHWRYNDDFRIGAASRPAAHEALETLEHRLRSIGLVLNDEKSSIRTRENYETWANAFQTRVAEIEDEIDLDWAFFMGYDAESSDEDVELKLDTAQTLLGNWLEEIQAGEGEQLKLGPEAVVERAILSASLSAYRQSGNPGAVSACEQILSREPSLTPQVIGYLKAILDEHEDQFDELLDGLITAETAYLSDWQSLWMMEVLKVSSGFTATQLAWTQERFASAELRLLRAAAANALATHEHLTAKAVSEIFDLFPEAAKPQLVVAGTLAAGSPQDVDVQAMTGGRPLFEWIADAAAAGPTPD